MKYVLAFIPPNRLDPLVEELLATFYKAVHTSRPGDGKVFVLDVEDALRLKTGERGPGALGPGRPAR